MKKFISVILSVALLISVSMMSSAEVTDTNSSTPGENESVNDSINLPQGSSDRIQNRQNAIEAIKAAFAQRKELIQQRKETAQARRKEFMNKREEYAAFREQLQARREDSLEHMRENRRLRAENTKLTADMRATLKSLDEQEIVLSEETINALKISREQIRTISLTLKETQNQIKSIIATNKGFIANKDYVGLDGAFDEINAIQQFRNESLQQINDTLKVMLQLIIAEV